MSWHFTLKAAATKSPRRYRVDAHTEHAVGAMAGAAGRGERPYKSESKAGIDKVKGAGETPAVRLNPRRQQA